MSDVVDIVTRSRMMANIGTKGTKPELLIRSAMHSRGFRYRTNVAKLPGKPDVVFPRYRVAVFVNGCFWHLHGCHLFRWPRTRPDFWRAKIVRNVQRDLENIDELAMAGWRVATIWECALKGHERMNLDDIADKLSEWLRSDHSSSPRQISFP